jgi:predicted aconitase with swiveling domain
VLLSATTTSGLHPEGEHNAIHVHFIPCFISGYNPFRARITEEYDLHGEKIHGKVWSIGKTK